MLNSIQPPPGAGTPDDHSESWPETELAAVLPFDVEAYRRSRPAWFREEFDRQIQACAWVLVLDGIYDKPSEDTLTALSEGEREGPC
ncbi:MAG: hypothetical protein ACKV19_23805 [Verrucomicrobiales bacterium]